MELIPRPEVSSDKIGHTVRVYPTEEAIGDKHLNFVEVQTKTGLDVTLRQRECTFIYLVLEGDGYFEINGEQTACRPGDMVIIPPGEAFTYKGCLRMLLVNTPEWSDTQEESL